MTKHEESKLRFVIQPRDHRLHVSTHQVGVRGFKVRNCDHVQPVTICGETERCFFKVTICDLEAGPNIKQLPYAFTEQGVAIAEFVSEAGTETAGRCAD